MYRSYLAFILNFRIYLCIYNLERCWHLVMNVCVYVYVYTYRRNIYTYTYIHIEGKAYKIMFSYSTEDLNWELINSYLTVCLVIHNLNEEQDIKK